MEARKLTAEEILAGPGRIECTRLRANVSTRQCAINQAQAVVYPCGPLAPCLRCDQADRARRRELPRRPVRADGRMVKTRQYLELEARGEVALSKFAKREREALMTGPATEGNLDNTKGQPVGGRRSLKGEIMELRDRSTRAGWSRRRIDRRLRQLHNASRAVKRALVRAWREELEGAE